MKHHQARCIRSLLCSLQGMLSGEETSGAMPAAHVSRDGSAAAAARQPEQLRQSEPSPAEQLYDWPILREGEGGKLVGGISALGDDVQE